MHGENLKFHVCVSTRQSLPIKTKDTQLPGTTNST